jgi:hypothetical protein
MRTEAFPCPHNETHMSDTPQTAPATTAQIPVIRDPRIFLGLPAYGGMIHSPFATSLLMLAQMQGSPLAKLQFLNGDSLVSRARNKLTRMFLNGFREKDSEGNDVLVKFDWLLFIDTDLIFRPADVLGMYDYALAHGPNVYAGAYPLKKLKPKVVFNPMPGAQIDADGIIEVREAGTGMMLIHREVFEKLIAAFGDEITYEADAGDISQNREIEHDFFKVGVRMDPILGYKRYLSEDWYFCQVWREIGGKVLMNTKLQCQHIGQLTYPAPMREIIETADAYRAAEKLALEDQARAEASAKEAAA